MKPADKAKLKQKKTKQAPLVIKKTLFDKAEKWFFDKQKILFITISVVFILLAFLLFSLRISEGGDDSTYIQAGYNYSQHFFSYFFYHNAPLYPMFLGLVIRIFGVNLFVLKLISLILSYFHIFFFYKALKNRIPQLVLFPVLIIISTNAFILFFASQTYNEAFFLFFQSLFFYYFIRLEDNIVKQGSSLKNNYQSWLIIGILLFVLTMTKNVAIIIIPAIALYLILYKRYMHIVYLICSFLLIKLPFELIKTLIWGNINQYGAQTSNIIQVNPYDKSKGFETISGFFIRFFENCKVYLSDILFQILGFKKEYTNIESAPLTIIIILILIIGIILIIKSKNKILQLLMFYGASIITASFIVLQKIWSQHRIILIEVPIMLIIIFFVFYKLFNRKSASGFQFLYFIMIIILFISGLILTTQKIKTNIPIIYNNIKGDKYYGYSPDWANYLLMSDWCTKNLKKTDKIACRKPSVSFIFTGNENFFGVFEVKTTNPDSALAYFKDNKITHLLLSSLRLNPGKPTLNIYNSLQRMVYPIAIKYPGKIQFITQIGNEETSYLYKINY
jgi:4-amino-4-deoxy-L-arabinose transferase-like glycosyltransferase